MLPFKVSGFYSLPRKACLRAGPSPDSRASSLGCKIPCAVLPLYRPSTLAVPSTVSLLGWLVGCGQKPTGAGLSRLHGERGNCLPSATGCFLFLVSHLFFSLSVLLSLCLSLSADVCLPPLVCSTPSPVLSPLLTGLLRLHNCLPR